DFKCTTDGNGKGIVNASIGLLSYDEVVYAGGYFEKANNSYYLYNSNSFWTMSPSAFSGAYPDTWYVRDTGFVDCWPVITSLYLRPVLNLKSNITVVGSGTSSDPFVIQ
ncbi:MAG: hypothetical protein MRZ42_01425, partial [Tenericutes bacterium]|nr:hypothetical protein [Mycoplasmatota bacterium]